MEYSILLLDDDEDLLELTKYNLESIADVKIHLFGDPVQALRRIHLFGAPDLIITDLELPGMHGVDFLARARRAYPEVKAIVFTGRPEALPRNCRYPLIQKGPGAFECLVATAESMLRRGKKCRGTGD